MNYLEKLEELKELTDKAFELSRDIHMDCLKSTESSDRARFYRLYSDLAKLKEKVRLTIEWEK